MTKSEESFSDSDATNMVHRALYVQPVARIIGLDTVPANGNEFIHKSRLEDTSLNFDKPVVMVSSKKKNFKNPKLDEYWLRRAAAEFSSIAIQLKEERKMLKKVYKPINCIPVESEQESCTYCLGSAKCSLIYKSEPLPPAEPHLPLLGDLLHLSQSSIFDLLEYCLKWYKTIGMDESIHMWIFTLLLCVIKPVNDDREELLEDFYDECKSLVDECDTQEFIRVHLIMSLLHNYFLVNMEYNFDGFLE